MTDYSLAFGRRLWQHNVNNIWARASTTPWYNVQVRMHAICSASTCTVYACPSPVCLSIASLQLEMFAR